MQIFGVQLGLFLLLFICLRKQIQKDTLLQFMSKNVLFVFSSRSFMVSGLILRLLIYFEFIFVYDGRKGGNHIILHVAVPFSQHHLLKRLSFSVVYSCLLCCRVIDHKCMGFSLGLLLCSIKLCICFCARIKLFWLFWLCSIVWSQGAWYLQVSSFFSGLEIWDFCGSM